MSDERFWRNDALARSYLRSLAARMDQTIGEGHEKDMVIIRATRGEAAMLRAIIEEALVK